MAAVSPVMVISLEISGPRRPGEPSSPARIAASLYSHNSNTNPASIGDPQPFYRLGPTFLSNKCQLGTKKVSYFFQFLPQTNFQYSGSNKLSISVPASAFVFTQRSQGTFCRIGSPIPASSSPSNNKPLN